MQEGGENKIKSSSATISSILSVLHGGANISRIKANKKSHHGIYGLIHDPIYGGYYI